MWGPVLTAMVTPFDAEGRVDLKAAAALADHLLSHGSDGILVNGTTGESPTLSHDEKLDMLRAVKDAVGGRGKVLMGTGNNCTATSIELTREASEIGVDGIMLVCPYYNKPTQEGLYQHFRAAAEATDAPVMVYNIQSRSARNILPETIGRLARDVANIVAVKEASASINQFAEMALATPDDFHLYSGNDADTPAILCCGGAGVVSVASHLAGDLIADMIHAFQTGDVAGGQERYLRLYPLVKALFPADSVSPAPVKAGLELLGLPAGGLRLPLVAADEAVRERVAKELKRLELI